MNSLAEFESGYVRLATFLGHRGKTPPPAELKFLASIAKRRKYYPGEIAPADHLFLTAVVSILAPRRVIEIGTLAGFSAGMIAAALPHQHGNDGGVWVNTIDIRPQCTADRSRPSGFEIAELFPEFASMIRLHIPADSSFVSKLAAYDEFGLAFIDADHRHPLPLLDLLRLTPYLRGQSWIVLHDIKLGTMTRQAIETGRKLERTPVFGAEWLFERWPFRKISGGNIGAVQLPADKGAVVALALQLMSKPFEITEDHARIIRPALYESLRRPIL
jgi:predicted O-methyltransferase YrrM